MFFALRESLAVDLGVQSLDMLESSYLVIVVDQISFPFLSSLTFLFA